MTIGILGFIGAVLLFKACFVVPQTAVFVVERLGKFHAVMHAGFHIIIPFIDRVAYRHSLKEIAIDTAKQICITRDNIAIEVDGVLYLQIIDPKKASYGIDDYLFGTIQIAQTNMRSVVGKLNLDQSFEEREHINSLIVEAADKASDPWGIKVIRYEIKDIKPPKSINDAMEKEMRAVREKRARVAESEGERQARINCADGEKQEMIARAEGRAFEVEKMAIATAEGIRKVAQAVHEEGGKDAVSLRVAEKYIEQFGNLARTNNTMIIPSNLTDISSIIATATSIYKEVRTPEEFVVTK
ncbi:MAG: paraslipin [Simkaniaceae bacterium]|nr:paraslipin [Simkaniaceae bacterium]